MIEIRKKSVVHEVGSLPLLTTKDVAKENWFKKTVMWARKHCCGCATGEYSFPLNESLCMDICMIPNVQIMYTKSDEQKMLKALDPNGNSLCDEYIRAYFSQSESETCLALEEWLCESVKQEMVRIEEMWKDTHFNTDWAIVQAVLSATEKQTVFIFGLEYRNGVKANTPNDYKDELLERLSTAIHDRANGNADAERDLRGIAGDIFNILGGADKGLPGLSTAVDIGTGKKWDNIESGINFYPPKMSLDGALFSTVGEQLTKKSNNVI